MLLHVVEHLFIEIIRKLMIKLLIHIWKVIDADGSFACFEEQSLNKIAVFLPKMWLNFVCVTYHLYAIMFHSNKGPAWSTAP